MDLLNKVKLYMIQGYVPNASDRILQGTISLTDVTYINEFLIMCLLFIEFSNSYILTILLLIDSFDLTVHMGNLVFIMNSALRNSMPLMNLFCSLRKVQSGCSSAPSLISFNN